MSSAELVHVAPRTWAWLQQNEPALREREGDWTEENWWAYSRRQNLELFCEPKILVPYMIDHLCAFLDPSDHFFVNVSTGGYGIPAAQVANPEYLTALLNSRLLSWVLRRYSRAFRGGWFAARKATLIKLPIAAADAETAQSIVDLYASCVATATALREARADHQRTIADRTHQIAVSRFDDAVENIYRLNDAERVLIQATPDDAAGLHDVEETAPE